MIHICRILEHIAAAGARGNLPPNQLFVVASYLPVYILGSITTSGRMFVDFLKLHVPVRSPQPLNVAPKIPPCCRHQIIALTARYASLSRINSIATAC